MPQRIIRTEDVVESLDHRIKTTTAHSQFNVAANERYGKLVSSDSPAVLDKLIAQTSSAAQKEAIDASISAPNATNPVVLKDAIKTYYPDVDLGEFKDAVDHYELLPLTGNSLGDMRPVLFGDEGQQIFRWSISSPSGLITDWVLFIKTGVLDHTSLTLQNGDLAFQHLTLAEATLVTNPAQTHTHLNAPAPTTALFLDQMIYTSPLDPDTRIISLPGHVPPYSDPDNILGAITSSGGGIIISDAERVLIPSMDTINLSPYTVVTTAGVFLIGASYAIKTVEDTDFTLLGAADNNIGTIFTATGIGTGTGTAYLISNEKYAMIGNSLIFEPSAVNISADTIAVSSAPASGFRGKFLTSGTLPSGLTSSSFYYVRNPTLTTFQVSLTPIGDIVDILSQGTGVHTFGSNLPSSANRFVTSVDPRLNTIKNPYVTLGLPGTHATFECTSLADLEAAFTFISSDDARGIETIETLPGEYPLEGGTVTWTTRYLPNTRVWANRVVGNTITVEAGSPIFLESPEDSFMIESFALRSAFFNMAPAHAGETAFVITGDYKGYGTIRGVVFVLDGTNALASLVQREKTIFEDCTFKTKKYSLTFDYSTVNVLANTITPASVPENGMCGYFSTTNTLPLNINPSTLYYVVNATPTTFQVSLSPLGSPIDIQSQGSGSHTFTLSSTYKGMTALRFEADMCKFVRCNIEGDFTSGLVITGNNCIVDGCRLTMADPSYPALTIQGNGTYVYANTLVQGKIVIGTAYDTVIDRNAMVSGVTSVVDSGINTRWLSGIAQDFQQAYIGRTRSVGNSSSYADFRGSSQAPFVAALADPFTTDILVFEGAFTFTASVTVPKGKKIRAIRKGTVSISGGSSSCLTLNDSSCLSGLTINSSASAIVADNTQDVEVIECTLNSSGSGISIAAQTTTDIKITRCTFTGINGISLTSAVRPRISQNRFTCITSAILLSSSNLYYLDNLEEGSSCSLGVSDSLIVGNQFLGALPSKLGTLRSVWRGNYPATANNENGIDAIVLPLNDALSPLISTGSYKGSFLGTAVVSFIETGKPTATMLPMMIGARLNLLSGFTATLSWIAAVFSGYVKWEVSVTFRDQAHQEIGDTFVQTVRSQRNVHSTGRKEEFCSLVFPASYGTLLNISHVSVTIKRLGDDPEDTLAGIAYLTNATITFSRD